MKDEYKIIKLLFHINSNAHIEWRCAKFGRGKYAKNMSLFDFQELQLENVIDFCFIILNTCSL